ncbi:MAG: copper homeostasis protein CutC [Candidatus Acidiferrum sp.]
MRSVLILEICVETVEAALAAERGGANRIELCADLSVGGVTPAAEMMRAVRERIRLPIHVMIRPRGGDFVYSNAEFEGIKLGIIHAKQLGMDGLVFGLLRKDNQVDVARTRTMVGLAHPLPVTFHRAFDAASDLHQALEGVVETGASRILTSGGMPTAPEAAGVLKKLIREAGDRIIVMPGSGIHAGNVACLATETGAREFHAGLSSVVPRHGNDFLPLEREVRKLVERMNNLHQ